MKKNHHYVPRFWLHGFRDSANRLYARVGTAIKIVSPRNVMQEDWLYTLFDDAWQPSDALEDALGRVEGTAAPIFEKLNEGHSLQLQEFDILCLFLGLQACRHPDVLGRGFRRRRELAALIASVHDFAVAADFAQELRSFGITDAMGLTIYGTARTKTEEQLSIELKELEGLSPQDPRLPAQNALQAFDLIANEIRELRATILDAPAGAYFVLGDTPMPQFELAGGFTVPFSKSVAINFSQRQIGITDTSRRGASTGEVEASNATQWRDARSVVVGPDPNALNALG